jgi:hypothetical protein
VLGTRAPSKGTKTFLRCPLISYHFAQDKRAKEYINVMAPTEKSWLDSRAEGEFTCQASSVAVWIPAEAVEALASHFRSQRSS